MCAFKDCERPGDMVPRLEFLLGGGVKKRTILGMEICAECRPGFMARPSVREATERILESLIAELPEPPKIEVEMNLEWLPLTHPDYRHHKGLGPS